MRPRTRSSSVGSPKPVSDVPLVPVTPTVSSPAVGEPLATPNVDIESPQFQIILAREIARALAQRDEGANTVAPLGTLDIASRVEQPMSVQPSSTSQEVTVDPNLAPLQRLLSDEMFESDIARFLAQNNNASGNPLANELNNVGNSPSNNIQHQRQRSPNSEG